MPTTITKTVAATSSPVTPDYTSWQAWEDAIPADLRSGTGTDEIWKAEALNQGEFVSGSTICNLQGHSTDATHYIWVTTATGASFRDNASVRSNSLFYNASNGVAIRCTASYSYIFNLQGQSYVKIENLQLKHEGNHYSCLLWQHADSNCTVNNCIVQGTPFDAGCMFISTNSVVTNSVFLAATSGTNNAIRATADVNFYGCTLVRIGSADGQAVQSQYGTSVFKDCALFNWTTNFSIGGGGAFTGSSYNATDAGSLTGSNNVTSLTFSDQFENTSNDFRAKSSGGLHAGSPDANILTDISNTTRSVSTPWIGAWEYVDTGTPPAMGGSFPIRRTYRPRPFAPGMPR